MDFDDLSIHNPSIKVLRMSNIYNLKNIFLSAPNLERLVYNNSSHRQKCSVNISSACVVLKILELKGVMLTDEWERSTISDLGCLKELTISDCDELEKMELKNDKLERLSLKRCSNLKEATIDAPNLLTFDYEGSLQIYPIQISSTKCNKVSIKLPQYDINPHLWFGNMKQFLSCFDHIEALTIVCSRAEDVIFPKEFVENIVSTLQDLKNVHIKVASIHIPESQTVMQLVKSMLWLAPKPMGLTFSIVKGHIITSNLKFEYVKEMIEEEGRRK